MNTIITKVEATAIMPINHHQRSAPAPRKKATVIDTADKTTGSRHVCTRVSLLTKMWDVDSTGDEIFSRRPETNRNGTRMATCATGVMDQQVSSCGRNVCKSKANHIPVITKSPLEMLTPNVLFVVTRLEYLTSCMLAITCRNSG